MAVGTVSSISDDVWQLISTTTLSSGTSATVATGLAGAYKQLMLAYRGVTTNTSSNLLVTLNADSTSGNYGVTAPWQTSYTEVSNSAIVLTAYTGYTNHQAGYLKIDNANQTIPHTVSGGGYVVNQIAGVYVPATAATVNSIEIKTGNGTSTFTAGTVLIYGIPA